MKRTGSIGLSKTLGITTVLAAMAAILVGCHHHSKHKFVSDCNDCLTDFQEIEYPDVCDPELASAGDLQTMAPATVSDFYEQEAWPMSLEEAIELALTNNQVLAKLGGVVVNAPQGTPTVFDPAIQETSTGSVEAALADFDTQLASGISIQRDERRSGNPLLGQQVLSNRGNFNLSLSKTTASGTEFTLSNVINRDDTILTVAAGSDLIIPSTWDNVLQAEVRQPLLRGFGTDVNRIAGLNAPPGVYGGVLIARIRGDVALADFEASVRDLVRDVERNYWELYFAYRNVNVQMRAREAARLIWDNRNKRVNAGLSRPDDEAQTRQQYFQFEQLVIDAVAGDSFGQSGVLGSERQLRRLLGLLNNDGRLIRPTTEPTVAPVRFDWNDSQQKMLVKRVELRRQKWNVRQRELELYAARKLNKWRLDFVGRSGARGFDVNLNDSWERLFNSRLDTWSMGFELAGPVGLRQQHLAVRNAELLVVREKSLLREQQKQLLLDLNGAYSEVDRSFESIKTAYNQRRAVLEELEPKRKRAEAGDEDIFFLLDALQRAAVTESAFHRAVANYNLALQNFVYTSGGMLDHYNVRLAEGDWTRCAEIDALRKQQKFHQSAGDPHIMDICPIEDGPVLPLPDLVQQGDIIAEPEVPAPADMPEPADTPDN